MYKSFLLLHLLCIPMSSVNADGLSKATSKFALDVLQLGTQTENVFFSPASLSICMGMVFAGARGLTKGQIKAALYGNMSDDDIFTRLQRSAEFVNTQSAHYTLNLANRAYIEKTFTVLPEYLNKLQTYFRSDIISVDFRQNSDQARLDINGWVANRTNSKIQDLIGPNSLNDMAKLVLVNAIYFKGDWALKFKPSDTKQHVFYVSSAKSQNVDMMKHAKQKFYFTENEDVQVLGLPYVGEELVLYVFLPKERFGLAQFEQKLDAATFTDLCRNARRLEIDEIQIPKFKLEQSLDLTSTLKQLNVTEMFSSSADLSGIDGQQDLFVIEAIHKAFIEINEEGSEAGAASGVIIQAKSVVINKKSISFIADHPFLFSIVDRRTWNVLFIGRYVNGS